MTNQSVDPGSGNGPKPSSLPGMFSPMARIRSIRRPPLVVGVYAITVVCGMLDAASFLGLGLIFVETMTGNILSWPSRWARRGPTAGSRLSSLAARCCPT